MAKKKEDAAVIAERMRRFKDKRKKLGWKLVTVWVPSKEDADKVTEFARKLRNQDDHDHDKDIFPFT